MSPNLTGVPETMLWTLHNRASEADRSDGILVDPKTLEIYRAINYDYQASFGRAEPSHAVRSMVFDELLRAFLRDHPRGVVINLGEGLETQRYRVATGDALWLSVDLPEAIAVREQFISPDHDHLHVACSVADGEWLERAPRDRPVMVTAQGLLMYLEEPEVARLVGRIAGAFPLGAVMVFDTIPVWFSRKTTRPGGWRWTSDYTMPPMPWGIDRHLIAPVVRSWSPRIAGVEDVPFLTRWPRGVARWLAPLAMATPILNRFGPSVTSVRFGPS